MQINQTKIIYDNDLESAIKMFAGAQNCIFQEFINAFWKMHCRKHAKMDKNIGSTPFVTSSIHLYLPPNSFIMIDIIYFHM
jgi:hypothetical protein